MGTDGFRQSEWKKESETVPGKVTKVIITGTDRVVVSPCSLA